VNTDAAQSVPGWLWHSQALPEATCVEMVYEGMRKIPPRQCLLVLGSQRMWRLWASQKDQRHHKGVPGVSERNLLGVLRTGEKGRNIEVAIQ